MKALFKIIVFFSSESAALYPIFGSSSKRWDSLIVNISAVNVAVWGISGKQEAENAFRFLQEKKHFFQHVLFSSVNQDDG